MAKSEAEHDYAVWISPESGLAVNYSRPAFHEIDFAVNEGYRRIPHGGVETGGILFGRMDKESVRVDAFRMIECEHAAGPSFVLSERDVTKLREQLANYKDESELQPLQPVGIFIAHTRSALEINDRELALFEELFPGAGKILVLIKPERFQPTRFAFFVRGKSGQLEGDVPEQASILPLPARSTTTEPAAPQPARPQSRVVEPRPEPVASNVAPAEPRPPGAIVPSSNLPSVDEVRNRRARAQLEPVFDSRPGDRFGYFPERRKSARWGINPISLGAALLGCCVGYAIYLLLPPAVIPLEVEPQANELIVSWPSAQTSHADRAALRIDDGEPAALSTADRTTGTTQVTAPGDNVQIELIAHHWGRDSRGIIRYVRAQKAPPPGR